MFFIADLHIHSRFSRATSPDMMVPQIARSARLKGISLVATGDFTHPQWLAMLKSELEPVGNGLFRHADTHFILSTEVNTATDRKGRFHQIHSILYVPSFEAAEAVNRALARYGNLSSDGRPILRLDAKQLVEEVFSICPESMYVPAHIWTPWFSLFGSKSGFDSIDECYQGAKSAITALETGLSSDPPMNWRLSELDPYALISNSDAHSPSRLGREANAFDCELSYWAIRDALKRKDPNRLLYTIEFFPEEGKYHYDGHRACRISLPPRDAIAHGELCPNCGRKLTVGVLHRVESLADRPEGSRPQGAIPYKNLVPLEEIIAQAIGAARDTAGVRNRYLALVQALGGEFNVLMNVPIAEITQFSTPRIAQGVENMRSGKVVAKAGYDGVFGVIDVFALDHVQESAVTAPKSQYSSEVERPATGAGEQMSLF